MNNLLRKLASSFESQILYARQKDGMSVEFFNNKKDFTGLQLSFMFWLEIYHGLYNSLSTDTHYLNQAVIDNETRCDAYLKHRIKLQKEIVDREKPVNQQNKKKKKGVRIPGLSVCFTPKK